MVDLDDFKLVNDTYGHRAGDLVLIEAARRMSDKVRTYDAVGRYGGEEFLIVLSDCDATGAGDRAERLRGYIAETEFSTEAAMVLVTASFGVACSRDMGTLDSDLLIQRADAALYEAKDRGRNCVVVSSLSPSQA